MTRFSRLKSYLLGAALFSLSTFGGAAKGTEIEERKAQVIEQKVTVDEKPKVELQVEVKGKGPNLPPGLVLPPELLEKLDADQLAEIVRMDMKKPQGVAELIFNEEILVPGIVFATIAGISFMFIYFSYRKRRDFIDTVRIAIQSGQTLPASFMEALNQKAKPTSDSDLRRAVLLITLGLSGTIVLIVLGNKEMGRAWAIGFVPTLLGFGYLYLWRHSQKKAGPGSTDAER